MKGADRQAGLRHVAYLGRAGAGVEGSRPEFFDRADQGLDAAAITRGWVEDRHHFRFIISPEHGDRIADLPGYVREVMARVSADLGEPGLGWIATCHFDTDQPHAHVLVRGRRGNGRDLVIPRHYVGYGFRARAQEVAQERLGDLSRLDAERRIWRETERDGFTSFDRRLLAAAVQSGGLVDDAVGSHGAWAALSRGRLRHLERLGLATPEARQYRLAPDLEAQLRGLQMRRDIIRTLNQRRLEGARDVRVFSGGRLQGEVVRSGYHDELGARPFAVVRDAAEAEQYVRLDAGRALPEVGAQLSLLIGQRGVMQVGGERGFGQGL